MRAPCPTHTNFETAGRGASNEVTYAISNQRLVSFFASLDSIAHSGSIDSRARSLDSEKSGPGSRGIHGLLVGFWRSNSLRTLPTRRPNVSGPGAAYPSANNRARPRAPHAPAATKASTTPRERPQHRAFWRACTSPYARTCHPALAVTSAPWVPVGPVYEVTA